MMIPGVRIRRLFAGLLLTAGCTDVGPQPYNAPPPSQPRAIAQVGGVPGPGAVIRPARGGQVAARNGMLLYGGDGFATDDHSTLRLDVLVGDRGTISVEPGTDPLLTDAACFTISFFNRGTIEVLGHHFCVDGPGGVVFMQGSDVVYSVVKPGVMRITVKEGRVTIQNRPGYAATTGQTFEVDNGRIIGLRLQPGAAAAPPTRPARPLRPLPRPLPATPPTVI